MRAARESGINPALALLLCVAAGAIFLYAAAPLPWMIGPLVAMAACNFAGAELRAPPRAREIGQVVIGTALGLYFTPPVVKQVLAYWPLLLLAGLFAMLLGVLGSWVLARASGVDRSTAFFASVPGGATEMTLLGEHFGARADRVALAQSLRVLMVVIAVPFAMTYSGVHGADVYQPAPLPLHWGGLALLLAVATGAGWLLDRLRMANAYMFGALAVAIILTACEVRLSALPAPASNTAQLLLGCALGARFERRSLESAPRYAVAVVVSVVVALAAAGAFAALLSWVSGVPAPSLMLAMAPGGIAEMCITAKVLQLGVPLVTAAHVTRVFVLVATTGPAYRAAIAWKARFHGT